MPSHDMYTSLDRARIKSSDDLILEELETKS